MKRPLANRTSLSLCVGVLLVSVAIAAPRPPIPPEQGSAVHSHTGWMLWYEDEGVEDCEANGTLDQNGKYLGWPLDCEGVFFPVLPYRIATEEACIILAVLYNQKSPDFFKCSIDRPMGEG